MATKSFAYMQLHVGDYLADTIHLTTEEHGAYLLLLFNHFQTRKPIPVERLQVITRLSDERWAVVQPTLEHMFNTNGNTWVHERVMKDLGELEALRKRRSKAGKASGKARRESAQVADDKKKNDTNTCSTPVKQKKNKRSTSVEPIQGNTIQGNTSNKSVPTDVGTMSSASLDESLDKPWESKTQIEKAHHVLGFLNDKTQKGYQTVTPKGQPTSGAKLVIDRVKDGFTLTDFVGVINGRCSAWLHDERMREYLRPQTLFTKSKFESYLGGA